MILLEVKLGETAPQNLFDYGDQGCRIILAKSMGWAMKNSVSSRSLLGQAQKSKNLADYQEGSVVSRTIIDKTTGTVTFFAFDKGQGLSEHTAPYDALIYIIEGAAEITIGGKPNNLIEGEMILMPANIPHSLKAVEKFKMLLIMIRS